MIHSIDCILEKCEKHKLIVVLYSGGLDGTYLLTKLSDYGYNNILALHLDISGDEEYLKIHERAKKIGVKFIALNKVLEFSRDFVSKSISMKGFYNNLYPISASLSRPAIAKYTIDFITENRLGTPAILHTSNSSQNSLRRFNNSLFDLKYKGLYGSPFERTHISRSEKLDCLKIKELEFDLHIESEDSNIWCREFEYGPFDDIEDLRIPEESFIWTTKKKNLEDSKIKITFHKGLPTLIDDKEIPLDKFLIKLRVIVGKYGIGRYVGLEEISSGHRVLEVRESPAATLLNSACKYIEMATLSYDEITRKNTEEQNWLKEASEGRWYGVKIKEIESELSKLVDLISGSVTFELTNNSFFPISIVSARPNYIGNRDKFESEQK